MGGKGSGGKSKKLITYYREEGFIYRILFIGLGGDILHQEDAKFPTRVEARDYAMDYAIKNNIQYHKLSIQRQQSHLTKTSRLKITDPSLVKEQRCYRKYTIFLNDDDYDKLSKVSSATGLHMAHYSKVVKEEIRRLYDMYFDDDGNLRQS